MDLRLRARLDHADDLDVACLGHGGFLGAGRRRGRSEGKASSSLPHLIAANARFRRKAGRAAGQRSERTRQQA
jgi:hypothetical protein